jgi:ribulose-phosphate 3-epimerase
VKAFVSLWSADPLAIGEAVEGLEEIADGFHIDVMDGQFVPQLLFGPDFVRALRKRTDATLDVHLMVQEADLWVEPFIEAGADMVTVHLKSTPDLVKTLSKIGSLGARPSIGLSMYDPVERIESVIDIVDRILLLGTAAGVKGAAIDPGVYKRVRMAAALRDRSRGRPEVFVDGGIRSESVPLIARAGADGVVPGSLVFERENWGEIVAWIQQQIG